MNRKLYTTVTAVALSFALVLGLGAFNVVKAAPYADGQRGVSLPAGEVNLFGADLAGNSSKATDKDLNSNTRNFAPDTYGIHGTLRP